MSYSADFIRVTYHAVECSLKVICEQLSSLLAENVGKGRQRGGGGKASYHLTQVIPSTSELFCFCSFCSCRSCFLKKTKPTMYPCSLRQRYLWESFAGG